MKDVTLECNQDLRLEEFESMARTQNVSIRVNFEQVSVLGVKPEASDRKLGVVLVFQDLGRVTH